MTAKEKALELVTYFEILINGLITENKMIPKECARKLVAEIIIGLGRLNVEILHTEFGDKLTKINGEIRTNYESHVIYWNEVIKEIKLS